MSGFSRFAWSLALAVALLFVQRPVVAADATKPQTVHVVAIDSDDADEQAEALTAALRSRVRETAGWTLLETTQSLSMLTAAYHCPPHPDQACLDRIGDTLKAEQFVWGILTKLPGHQVSAEVHLWKRGKPDQVAREGYSDNLKDPNDDSLKKVATRISAKLLGLAGGTLVVHATNDTGNVVVDGGAPVPLDHGQATLTLTAGPHTIEVQSTGFVSAKREVAIVPSVTSQLEIELQPDMTASVASGPSKPLPWRTIAGWSAIAAGSILVVSGVVLGVNFLGDQSDLNAARGNNYGGGKDLPIVTNPCSASFSNSETIKGCNAINDAHSAEVGEITTLILGGALIGTGTILLLTDHGSSPTTARSTFKNVHFKPSFGPGNGSLVVVGQF